MFVCAARSTSGTETHEHPHIPHTHTHTQKSYKTACVFRSYNVRMDDVRPHPFVWKSDHNSCIISEMCVVYKYHVYVLCVGVYTRDAHN